MGGMETMFQSGYIALKMVNLLKKGFRVYRTIVA